MPPRRYNDHRSELERRAAHVEAIRQRLDGVYRAGFQDGMIFSTSRQPARMILTTAELEQVRAHFDDAEPAQ